MDTPSLYPQTDDLSADEFRAILSQFVMYRCREEFRRFQVDIYCDAAALIGRTIGFERIKLINTHIVEIQSDGVIVMPSATLEKWRFAEISRVLVRKDDGDGNLSTLREYRVRNADPVGQAA